MKALIHRENPKKTQRSRAARSWALTAGFVLTAAFLSIIISEKITAAGESAPESSTNAPAVEPAATAVPSTPTRSVEKDRPAALVLTPSVLILAAGPAQSITRSLTISNETPQAFEFEMIAQDVVVKSGKRVFVSAGETPGSIAAAVSFSPKHLRVDPGREASVQCTITLPRDTSLRAVVAIFRGINKISAGENLSMTASVGSLITFELSKDFQLEAEPIQIGPQTQTANLSFQQALANDGPEVVIPKGVAAIINDAGTKVGTAPFLPSRLLPGERLVFTADCPFQLRPGRYRVVTSFQYEGKIITSESFFGVS